jgi:hemerythrin superfamily protein
MDAVKLIKEDHRMVERLFKKFRQAGPRAYRTKEGLARRITRELSVHASIEEQLLYPALRNAEGNGEVEEALHEHQEVKEALAQLETMSPEDPRFDETMNRVIEDVTLHAKEEERDMLPKLRNALTRKDLNELGDRMKTAKKVAPTRPHPSAPNTPPGEPDRRPCGRDRRPRARHRQEEIATDSFGRMPVVPTAGPIRFAGDRLGGERSSWTAAGSARRDRRSLLSASAHGRPAATCGARRSRSATSRAPSRPVWTPTSIG